MRQWQYSEWLLEDDNSSFSIWLFPMGMIKFSHLNLEVFNPPQIAILIKLYHNSAKHLSVSIWTFACVMSLWLSSELLFIPSLVFRSLSLFRISKMSPTDSPWEPWALGTLMYCERFKTTFKAQIGIFIDIQCEQCMYKERVLWHCAIWHSTASSVLLLCPISSWSLSMGCSWVFNRDTYQNRRPQTWNQVLLVNNTHVVCLLAVVNDWPAWVACSPLLCCF